MGQSLDRGHVLALSLWDDVEVNMLWLDSAYPLDKPHSQPGVLRGDCPGGESSTPTYVRNTYPDGYVTFANAAIGEIGFSGVLPPAPTPAPTPVPTPTPTPSPTPGLCKPWCSTSPKPWSQKCNKAKCEGCSACLVIPTPAPTPSPTPGLCKPWCSTSPKPWSQKCNWDKCKGCSACSVTPTPAPTPSPTPGDCKSWCPANSQDWAKKCLWEKCRGCPDCTSGVRRLRGSQGNDVPFSNEELLV